MTTAGSSALLENHHHNDKRSTLSGVSPYLLIFPLRPCQQSPSPMLLSLLLLLAPVAVSVRRLYSLPPLLSSLSWPPLLATATARPPLFYNSHPVYAAAARASAFVCCLYWSVLIAAQF